MSLGKSVGETDRACIMDRGGNLKVEHGQLIGKGYLLCLELQKRKGAGIYSQFLLTTDLLPTNKIWLSVELPPTSHDLQAVLSYPQSLWHSNARITKFPTVILKCTTLVPDAILKISAAFVRFSP